MGRAWRRLLAYWRLSKAAVCEESKGLRDYHDWPDSDLDAPWHFSTHHCVRCGKAFVI